jgi:hypothetical protein
MAPNEKEQKEIGEVGLWLPCSWDGCHDLEFSPRECPFYWLRSQFQVEDDSVIDGLSLVYEEAAVVRIRVNGRELSLPRERYPLWTVENHRVGIADAVRRGRNTLEILCRTDEWSSPERKSMFDMNFIDPVVLHGNFATEVGNKVVRLSARPQTLRLGDIGKQGFPWLLGDVRYRLVIQGGRFTALELPDIGEASADGSLNGEPLGTRLWDPFRFDLEGKLRAGENEFIATIPTSLGNFLPRAFPSRRVALTQIGLLQPPELS